MPKTPDNSRAATTPPAGRRRRRARRILLWAGIPLVLLAGLFFLAPVIASSGPVRRRVVRYVNERIQGRIELDALRVGWFSATELRGVRLFDEQTREVARLPRVTLSSSLWGLITSAERLGDIELASPRLVLHVRPDGELSIVRAVSPVRPRRPDEPPTRLTALVRVSDGELSLSPVEGGPRLDLAELAGKVRIALPDMVGGELTAVADGGAVEAEFELTGLDSPPDAATGGLTGTAKLRVEPKIELERWGGLVQPGLNIKTP